LHYQNSNRMKHLQLSKTFLMGFLTSLIILSCSSDDSGNNNNDPQNILEEERVETTQILSNTSNKTWKISQAVLTNENATIDISSNFNIVDDEFVFNTEGNLEWRQGNDINIEGTSNQETLLDYYRSPISSTFSFNQDSSSNLTAFDGRFSFTVVDESTINGVITFPVRSNVGGQIEVVMTEKQPGDYATPVTSGLNFTEVFTFQSDGINGHAPGMIGSYSDNSLFLVTREDGMADVNGILPERIIKFNIDNGITDENLFFNSDFVSKQLHIINNELVVIGGQYVNTYPLDFSSEPNSTQHGLAITRFGMSVSDDDAYIVGGDLDMNGDQNVEAEKIYKWSLNNQSLEYVTDLPEDRFGARSTIVNDKLYVFGGTTTFAPSEQDGHDSIYIYDIINGGIDTEQMIHSAEYTYVDKYQNLIYVSGIYRLDNSTWDLFFGVYNTTTNVYEDISHNLNTSNLENLHGMSIFNNKMYLIYRTGNEPENQWSIMSTDIN